MAEGRRRARRRQGTGRNVRVGIITLGLLVAAPAGAAELNLLATSAANFASSEVGGQSASQTSFTQSLDMNYNRNVTPLLSYRLLLRAADTESSSTAASATTTSSSRFVEPQADLTLAGTRYSVTVGARLREAFTESTQSPGVVLARDHEFVRAFFTPELLPAFNAQFERTAETDDRTPRGLDTQETRAILGANYSLAQKVNLAYTFTNQTRDNGVAQRTQEQRTHVGTANYADSFLSDRLTLNGSYFVSRTDTTERFSVAGFAGGGSGLPSPLSGAFSLTETDPTVAAASKVPPETYTTLNPSTGTTLGIAASLIVNDGGTPNRNQSIAVGLSPGASIITIRLTVSPRAGDFRDISLQAQGVTFQVFAAANPQINLTGWTLVPILSVVSPTSLDPFFEITFGATGGSFLKIHVAADTQQPAFPPLTATAIQAFSPSAGTGGTGRLTTGNLVQSVTGGILARPISALSINGNATFNTNSQDPSGRRDDSTTYSVTATGTPHPLLTATALYQDSFTSSSDPQTPQTDSWITSLTLGSTPLPTLGASLSGSHSENSSGGVTQNRSDSIGFNTALKPYRNLNVDLTATGSQAQNFVGGTKSQGFSTTLNANAILTARLTGLAGYTFATNRVTGGAAPSSVTSNTGFLSLTYTVSRFLNANGRWDFSTSDGNHIITQQYRLDIIPTVKTSVFITYVRTDQQASGTSGSTDSVALQARWNISRYLDLNTTTTFTRGISGDTVYTVSGTLAFRL